MIKHSIEKMTLEVKMTEITTPVAIPMMTLTNVTVCIDKFDQTSTHNLLTHTYALVKGL